MTTVFGERYSGLYDQIYQDKNYVAECDLLERVFAEYGAGAVRDVLDLGCGTGGHSHVLAGRGYRVVGVDRSRHMVERAREKTQRASACTSPTFHVADVREFCIDLRFDAVLMMFAVLDYQLEDRDILSVLESARRHLRPGGLLIFDCWYGPAVDHQKPTPRSKVVATKAGRVVRSALAELDRERNRCTVSFHVDEEIGKETRATDETHCIRYFYRPELESFLQDAGLELLRLGAMPDFDRPADETSWNALAVARCGGTVVDRA
jgi:SAM-dependent methyltransferase